MDIILTVCVAVAAVVVYAVVTNLVAKTSIRRKREEALKEAEAEGEMLKKEKILQAKEKFIQLKSEHDRQVNERNQKLAQSEQRAKQIEQNLQNQQRELENRMRENERMKEQLQNQLQILEHKKEEVDQVRREQNVRLEQISGMSSEEAKNILVENMKAEAKADAAAYINETIEEAKMTATKEAKRIIVASIQRVATETAIENAVTVFNIESDEVKGRIIGREGRNIRSFEQLTGTNLIIDDTPECVTISCFDPVRREIGRVTMENLIADGRIHPSRIEEMYDKAVKLVNQRVHEAGEQATFDAGIHDLHPELVNTLGRLRYRTSFGQNVLNHSLEVAYLASVMASELGLDPIPVKRAGLLHDLGKAVDHEVEGSHAVIGADLARRFGERPEIVHAIEAHHNDVEANSVVDVLIQAADAVSAARPGARKETLDAYVKRLEKLEEIANSHKGVERTYAIQAGREVRVMVEPEVVDEAESVVLAHDIAQQIENEMQYPGQVKVVVIRESRAVDYAK